MRRTRLACCDAELDVHGRRTICHRVRVVSPRRRLFQPWRRQRCFLYWRGNGTTGCEFYGEWRSLIAPLRSAYVEVGSLRLLSEGGAPSIDGVGRLEVFLSGAWAPVCSEGFTDGAAAVACKSMGFTGAEPARGGCVNAGLCGVNTPHLSNVECVGSESSLLSCPHIEGGDVYCAPEESVVVRCIGDGDAMGRSEAPVAPHWGVALRG